MDKSRTQVKLLVYMTLPILYPVCVTPGIITIAKYYFSENKMIEPSLILESKVNW